MKSSLDFRPKKVTEIRLSQLAVELGGEVADRSVPGVDPLITGISLDSTRLRSGDIFAALSGKFRHGAEFADRAVAAGAVAILTNAPGVEALERLGIQLPIIVVDEPRLEAAKAAKIIYTGAQKCLPKVFGVTGTNGKTMTVYLLDELARMLGFTTAISTTAERRIGEQNLVGGLTTPESTELHALIGVMAEQEINLGLIEVSAQAVTHNRVLGQNFAVTSFLNLSHDHLDDYPDMESYYQAKAQLFTPEFSARGVIALDTEWGQRLSKESQIPGVTVDWIDADTDADWSIRIDYQNLRLSRFTLINNREKAELTAEVGLFGAQVIFDAAVAILMFLEAGEDIDRLKSVLAEHTISWTAPGRMEILYAPTDEAAGPIMILDYGHTPEAFTHSLRAIRSVHSDKVVMLFGVDGDRDTSKRIAMAQNAAAGSDTVIVTDYNPRFEDPAAIRKVLVDSIAESFPEVELYEEADPARAIRLALTLAKDGGLVFWAGPGHEDYREVKGERVEYSSREDSLQALSEGGWLR